MTLGKEKPDTENLELPCGQCMGCRETKAKGWALRCHLEFKDHKETAFTTLTYRYESLPVTLSKRHLQLFIKRLRKRFEANGIRIRFFACGEYGEKNGRPHYHAVLFGVGKRHEKAIEAAWPHGHVMTVEATPAAINYVAGYTAKKLGDMRKAQEECVDDETGEVYNYVPPFITMSKKPGIGAKARKFRNSWRTHAVHNGKTQPVPRYLHEAWKKDATPMEIEELKNEKTEILKKIRMTKEQREAAQLVAIAKQRLKAARRSA